MTNPSDFTPIRVRRTTTETDFELVLTPRRAPLAGLNFPDRMLAHLLDHLAKAAGFGLTLTSAKWPRSWEFDHVLCEDFGQLLGRGIQDLAAQLARQTGIAGRAAASSVMDGSASKVLISFESRPRCDWRIPRRVDVDGFVDNWFAGPNGPAGACYGTNLRQFFSGFVYGSGATLLIEVTAADNLHHLYETIFRSLGDALGSALGTTRRLAGESSGLAGSPIYEVHRLDDASRV